METKKDNYRALCDFWRNHFLQLDHEMLIRRFHLQADSEALYITYYTRKYRISRKSGLIREVDGADIDLGFSIQMAIYHLFCYSKPHAALRKRFVPFREIPGAAPYAPAFQRSVNEGLAQPFSGHVSALKSACEALCGTPFGSADAGYIIHAFDIMPVVLLFWDGDEDFSAQANLLFDAGITDFIHEETVCCIADDLMLQLRKLAAL